MAAEKELTPQEANERDQDKLRKAAEQLERGNEPDDDEPDDDAEPEPQREDPRPGPDDERPTRRERRRARYSDMERELAEVREQLQQMRSQPPMPVYQQPPQQPRDFDAEDQAQLEELRQADLRIARAASAFGDKITQDDIAFLQQQQDEVNARRAEVNYRRIQRREQAQQQPQVHPAVLMLNARYIDVINSPLAMAHARVKHEELKARGQNTLDSMEEAYKYGRAQAQGGTRERPSDAQRARYTGSGGNGGQGSRTTPNEEMTAEEKRAANLAFSYEPDEKKRYARFRKEVLPKMRQRA